MLFVVFMLTLETFALSLYGAFVKCQSASLIFFSCDLLLSFSTFILVYRYAQSVCVSKFIVIFASFPLFILKQNNSSLDSAISSPIKASIRLDVQTKHSNYSYLDICFRH